MFDKLIFQPIAGPHERPLRCNHCGKEELPESWLFFHLYPYRNPLMRVSFIVCGDQCRQAFINDPEIITFIMVHIVEMATDRAMELNDEYKILLNRCIEQ